MDKKSVCQVEKMAIVFDKMSRYTKGMGTKDDAMRTRVAIIKAILGIKTDKELAEKIGLEKDALYKQLTRGLTVDTALAIERLMGPGFDPGWLLWGREAGLSKQIFDLLQKTQRELEEPKHHGRRRG